MQSVLSDEHLMGSSGGIQHTTKINRKRQQDWKSPRNNTMFKSFGGAFFFFFCGAFFLVLNMHLS